jgi:hypothetical protein
VSSALQLGVAQIVYQLRSVDLFKQMVHLSHLSVENNNNINWTEKYSEKFSEFSKYSTFQPLDLSTSGRVVSNGKFLLYGLKDVVEIVDSLLSLFDFYFSENDSDYGDNIEYFNSLVLVMAKACLHLLLNSKATINEIENSPKLEGNNEDDDVLELNLSQIEEINTFLELLFCLFRKEIVLVGLNNSICLKFIELCLEVCHQNSIFDLKVSNLSQDDSAKNTVENYQYKVHEASSIRLIQILGKASVDIRDEALISIIFEGLIGLQTYKMSSHFTGSVIKQLIDLATQSIVIVSKSLLSIVSDTLISNFEHEYSRLFILLNKIQNSEIESEESFQITEFLTGVSDGFAQLAKNLFRNQNLEYLSALKLQLSDLFVRLALIIYNENSHSSLAEGNTRRIELVESLGLLLHPISLEFELTSILKAQNSLIFCKNELPHIRHL